MLSEERLADLVRNVDSALGGLSKRKVSRAAGRLQQLSQDVDCWRAHAALKISPSKRLRRLDTARKHAVALERELDPAGGSTPVLERIRSSPIHSVLLWQYAREMQPDRPEKALGSAGAALLLGVAELKRLRQHLERASSETEAAKQAGRGGARNKGDWPLEMTARELLTLYSELTGKNVGLSWDSEHDRPTGPLQRMFEAVLAALGWTLTPKAIHQLIRRARKDEAEGQYVLLRKPTLKKD